MNNDLGVGDRKWVNQLLGLVAWIVGLIYFFPILWMLIISLKTDAEAESVPSLRFSPSLDRYREVSEAIPGTLSFSSALTTSVIVVLLSTAFVMVLSIPAAYALSIRPVSKWRDVLFFFISTKFLPIVASILPLYILADTFGLLNTRTVLVVLYTGMNIPLAIWMLRSFFRDVPSELIEAAEIDGASLWGQMKTVVLPIALPGIAATALLCLIFAWNEYFYAVQLNSAGNQTIPFWVNTHVSTRGGFMAKLSAASVIASVPVVIAGWVAQKRMIRGLAMGAIK